MFGTAGLKWKEADLITICKPSAHMQTSKNPRILKSLKSQSVQKGFFFFKCKILLLASLLFTPVILPTNVAFLSF